VIRFRLAFALAYPLVEADALPLNQLLNVFAAIWAKRFHHPSPMRCEFLHDRRGIVLRKLSN
jgi:hypothetical protein